MRILWCAALALILAGCLGMTQPVQLRNTAGQTAQCGPYPQDDIASTSSAMREAQCIADFQRQGFERVSAR